MREALFRGFHECGDGTKSITINGIKCKGEWLFWDKFGKLSETLKVGKRIWGKGTQINYKDIIPETEGQWVGFDMYSDTGFPLEKIFEGDIIYIEETKTKYIVYLEKGCFYGFKDYKDFELVPVDILFVSGKVVGNVFEGEVKL